MIDYDEEKWGVLFAFSLKGSAFPRACIWALPCGILSALLNIALMSNQVEFFRQPAMAMSGDLFRGFTFVLGFLIVFRSQVAYSRWWEGGTLLQQLRGEWSGIAKEGLTRAELQR